MRDIQHLFGVAGAKHAELVHDGLGHRVVAGDGGGVRFRRFRTQLRPPDLLHHHRFARGSGRFQRGDEAGGLADALGIDGDHVHVLVFGQPADALADGHVAFVAGHDAGRGADAAVAGQGIKMRAVGAGLGGDADPPRHRPAAIEG